MPNWSATPIMAMVLPILPSERSFENTSAAESAISVAVPSSQKLFGQRLANSGERSVVAVTRICG